MFRCITKLPYILYPSQVKDRQEIVQDLTTMVGELLVEYHKVNAYYPEQVIVFRDGVSEGQFNQVKQTEGNFIRAAFNKVAQRNVKITMIIVQKGHHTRFARQSADTSGRKATFNVPSGTVVDNTIVEPLYKMFYLNSHFSPLVSDQSSFESMSKLGPEPHLTKCFQ